MLIFYWVQNSRHTSWDFLNTKCHIMYKLRPRYSGYDDKNLYQYFLSISLVNFWLHSFQILTKQKKKFHLFLYFACFCWHQKWTVGEKVITECRRWEWTYLASCHPYSHILLLLLHKQRNVSFSFVRAILGIFFLWWHQWKLFFVHLISSRLLFFFSLLDVCLFLCV